MQADHAQLSFLPNRREDVFVKSVWGDVFYVAGGDFRIETQPSRSNLYLARNRGAIIL